MLQTRRPAPYPAQVCPCPCRALKLFTVFSSQQDGCHRLNGRGECVRLGRVGHAPAPDLAVHGAGVERVTVLVPRQVMHHPLVRGPRAQQLQLQAPGLDAAIVRARVENILTK